MWTMEELMSWNLYFFCQPDANSLERSSFSKERIIFVGVILFAEQDILTLGRFTAVE